MPKKAGSTGKVSRRAKRDQIDRTKLMKDLRAVLRRNGITAQITALSFSSVSGSSCTCPDGKSGVLRVVGGKLICVCPN